MTQLSLEEAVAYLTEKPEQIEDAWTSPSAHAAGRLFQMVRPYWTGENPDGSPCACLTMVRGGDCRAWNEELTAAIRADERIPVGVDDVTPDHLPFFRDWQTYLDSAIRGVDPTGIEFCPIVLDLARKAGAWLPEEKPKRELPAVILDSVNWQLVFSSEKKLAATSAD